MKKCNAANFQSVTDHLKIFAFHNFISLQMVNMFKNIKSLDIKGVQNQLPEEIT
jgi:hypothetical protein